MIKYIEIRNLIIVNCVYILALFFKRIFNIFFVTHSEERIGEILPACDQYLRKKIINPSGSRVICVIGKPCNRTLINIIKKKMSFIESQFFKDLIKISHKKLLEKNLIFPFADDHFSFGLHYKVGPQLNLSKQQIETGFSQIKKMGINRDDWWVCFHVRDPSYLKDLYQNRDMSYHNYRDFSEETMHKGIEEVTRRGGFVILMSDISKESSLKHNPFVVKYNKNTFKTDFLDIFLTTQAKFFVGSSSGLRYVPTSFGVPVALCNHIGFNFLLPTENSLMIFKKLFCLKKKRLLTYDEMLGLDLFDQYKGTDASLVEYFKEKLMVPVDNSEEEITELVKDMFDIIDKNLSNSNILIQKQFKQHFYSKQKDIDVAGNISPSFLKLNKNLFNALFKRQLKKSRKTRTKNDNLIH